VGINRRNLLRLLIGGWTATLMPGSVRRNAVAGERDHGTMKSAGQGVATIVSTRVIAKQEGRYIAWPSVARIRSGGLLVVFSGDRDAHPCPWGKTYLTRSHDDGRTWSEPERINNTPLDDRDAGVLETRHGTLIVSWYSGTLFRIAHTYPPRFRHHVTPEMLTCWARHWEKITDATIQQWRHSWLRRSTDGGATWEEPIRLPAHSPHGPVELSDGRLLYVGNQGFWVAESTDDGRSWQKIGSIPRSPDLSAILNEPDVVEVADGRLIAMFRYEPPQSDETFLHQSESTDGGRSWSEAHATIVWADNPPHVIRLRDGRLAVVYGRRSPPYGLRACISADSGATWDYENEVHLSTGPDNDLGYPASVELDDGSILTVYYQVDEPGEKPSLMGTHWRLNGI